MAYKEYDDRDLDLNDQSDLYAEDSGELDDYNFGERIEGQPIDDELGDDEALAEEEIIQSTDPAEGQVEEAFGETLTSNPHLSDQLEDEELSRQAESDYSQGTPTSADQTIDQATKDETKPEL